MLFERIAQTSEAVAGTRSRREKTALLAEAIGELEPGEVEPGVAYLAGELPQGKIGVGYATLRELRDVPAAATASLRVAEVDAELTDLAGISGAGSAAERKRRLGALLGRCTGAEAKLLGRLIVGELRQGALTAVVLEAVARRGGVTARRVRRAHMLSGELGAVARAALVEPDPSAALERFSLQLFRPVLPMLAQPSDDVDAALERLGEAALEWKLDGARVQLHKDGDDVRVYSRRLNDVTAAVPEIVEAARALPARSAILDGETLALRDDGSPHPFQVTMRRFGRRLDVDALRGSLPLSVFFFDCLYLDGEELLDRSGRERAQALGGAVPSDLVVPRRVTGDPAAADAFWSDALARGHWPSPSTLPTTRGAAARRGSSSSPPTPSIWWSSPPSGGAVAGRAG